MKIEEVVSNVNIYGLEEAVRGSKYPMATDLAKLNSDITKTVGTLAGSEPGSGHDQFLTGITVQFDLTCSNKMWVEAERYRFLYFVSSQSTMHRITRFDLDKQYIEYVDERMIAIMKEKVADYNRLLAEEPNNPELPKKYLEVLYSNPSGFRLTAKMVTNYRQLKTIYRQRRTHRLPEWQAFCDWIETLPYSKWLTGKEEAC